jgi:TolB-like protein
MAIWTSEIKDLEKLFESLKGQLPALGKELEQLIKFDDPNVIMLYSRRCLEVIITDLCECELKRPRGTEPLKGIIDKLHKERKVPDHISTSMHGLNDLSTYGTHPKDFDPAQVKPVLNNLDIIIKWYLKYKDVGIDFKAKPGEEIREDIKSTEDVKKSTQIPKNRLIGLVSGLVLLIVIVVAVLFLTNIIGSGKETKELEKSIAVLPFINETPVDSNKYFINGLMEEVLNNLQKIKDFRVLSRTSTDQYKGSDRPTITEIAKKLGVSYIVEGSGQKYGNTFRLRVQLIKAKGKENHLWARSYERELREPTGFFNIQSQIAQAIASELKAIITPEEKQIIAKVPTSKMTAYNLYLRANNYLKEYEKNRDSSYYQNAVTFYKAALEIDHSFARAYAGLANAYYYRHYWETYFKENYLDSIRILADRALSFDDQLDEAYYIKGEYYELNGHIDEALENYDKALKINPNYYAAYERKGWVLTSIKNDYVNGIDNYNNALKLISGNDRPSLLRDLGFAYKDIGFFEKARYYYNEAFTLDSNKAANFDCLFILAAVEGKFDEAMEIERKLQEMDSTYIPNIEFVDKEEAFAIATKIINYYKESGELNIQGSGRVGFALWRVGKYEEARDYLNLQIKYSKESIKLNRNIAHIKAAYYDLATVYAFLGNKEKAYQYLDELIKGNTCQIRWIFYLKNDSPLASIRGEERFQKLLKSYEAKYQAEHERVRKWLEEQGML